MKKKKFLINDQNHRTESKIINFIIRNYLNIYKMISITKLSFTKLYEKMIFTLIFKHKNKNYHYYDNKIGMVKIFISYWHIQSLDKNN